MSVPRVFICHSTVEAELALELAEALDALGAPSWIAPRNVPPGAVFTEAVITAIRDVEATAVLLSPAALESDFVLHEVIEALNHKRQVFVFATDDSMKSHNELPLKWQLPLAGPQVVPFPGTTAAAAVIAAGLHPPLIPGGTTLEADLRDLGVGPEIVALVRSVTARSHMQHQYVKTSRYISLRQAEGTPVKLFVRRAHVTLLVTPALAKRLLADGIGTIEKAGGHTTHLRITATELASPPTLERVADILAARDWTKGTLTALLNRLISGGHAVQAKVWTAAVANGGEISREAVLAIAGLEPTHDLKGFTTALNSLTREMRDSGEIPKDAICPLTPVFEKGSRRAKGFQVPDNLVALWNERSPKTEELTHQVKITTDELASPNTLVRAADIVAAGAGGGNPATAGGWTKGTLAAFHSRLTAGGHTVQAKVWTAAVEKGGEVSRAEVYEIGGYDPGRSLRGFMICVNKITREMRGSGEIPTDAIDPLTTRYEGSSLAKSFRVPDSLVKLWNEH